MKRAAFARARCRVNDGCLLSQSTAQRCTADCETLKLKYATVLLSTNRFHSFSKRLSSGGSTGSSIRHKNTARGVQRPCFPLCSITTINIWELRRAAGFLGPLSRSRLVGSSLSYSSFCWPVQHRTLPIWSRAAGLDAVCGSASSCWNMKAFPLDGAHAAL